MADVKVRYEKAIYPYSVGAVVESLQGAGLETDLAIKLATDLEKAYRKERVKEIRLEHLMLRLGKMVEKASDEVTIQRFKMQTPPFIPISVILKDGSVPFSVQTLSKDLEQLGLVAKEATAISGQIEQSLRSRGYQTITIRELVHWVAMYLDATYGRELRHLFETQQGQPTAILVVEANKEKFPFSRGILAQSLIATGLEPETAYELANKLEDELWHRSLGEISREKLHQEVKGLLLRVCGKAIAQRYEQMHQLRSLDKPLIVLIGGAPGTGKSTLAAELGYRLGIRRLVSSDAIREALRSLVSSQLSPGLHASSYTAWRTELLPGEDEAPGRKRVIRGYQSQAQQLSAALTAIIKRSIAESTSLVIEGVHLLPGLLSLATKDALIVPMILAVPDQERHRRYFELRDKQTHRRRQKKSYLKYFTEIRIVHDFIIERALDKKVPVIQEQDAKKVLEQGLRYILESLPKPKK